MRRENDYGLSWVKNFHLYIPLFQGCFSPRRLLYSSSNDYKMQWYIKKIAPAKTQLPAKTGSRPGKILR